MCVFAAKILQLLHSARILPQNFSLQSTLFYKDCIQLMSQAQVCKSLRISLARLIFPPAFADICISICQLLCMTTSSSVSLRNPRQTLCLRHTSGYWTQVNHPSKDIPFKKQRALVSYLTDSHCSWWHMDPFPFQVF